MARENAAPSEELGTQGNVETLHRNGGRSGDQEGRPDTEGAGGVPVTPSRERLRVPLTGADKSIRDLNAEADEIMAKAGFRHGIAQTLEQHQRIVERRQGFIDTVEKAVSEGTPAPFHGMSQDDYETMMNGPNPPESEISHALGAICARVNILNDTSASIVLVATELAEIRNQLNGKFDQESIATTLFGTQVFQPAGAVILCKRQELQQRLRQLQADLSELVEAVGWSDRAATLPSMATPPTALPAPIDANRVKTTSLVSDETLKKMEEDLRQPPPPPPDWGVSGVVPLADKTSHRRNWLDILKR